MIGMVLSDFRMRKIVLGENKSQKRWTCAQLFFLAINIWNIGSMINDGLAREVVARRYVVVVPLLVLLIFSIQIQYMYPTSLSKVLCLVPMDRAERASYLRCCFWIKQWGLSAVAVLVSGVLVGMKRLDLTEAVMLDVSFFIIMLQQGAPTNRASVVNLAKFYQEMKDENSTWIDYEVMIIGGVGYVLLMECSSMNLKVEEKWVYLFILVQILYVPWIVKGLKERFRKAVETENIQRSLEE